LQDRTLLRTGVVGTIVTAVCCFTPVLVILLGLIGLSAIVSWLDFVLLPALGAFVAVTAYALIRRREALWRN
jgi:mercuric ion transport protein